MQGWVGWSGMSEGKEGSLCGSVCGLYGEIKDVYASALMKVCFPTVFTPLGPAAYLTLERRVMGEKKCQGCFLIWLQSQNLCLPFVWFCDLFCGKFDLKIY